MLLTVSIVFLTLSISASIYRLVKGPSIPDRVQALDAIGINLISGVAVTSVTLRTSAFFEVILLVGILSFIGTIAFARYLERGVAIEHNRSE